MKLLENRWRGPGLGPVEGIADGEVLRDADIPVRLMAQCPIAHETPLLDCDPAARDLGIAGLFLKDERDRLGLGSFKALGAAYAIAKRAAATGADDMASALSGQTFVCASAGNHGLSMAAGASLFGADSVVFLSDTVPESFAARLRRKGAKVIRSGAVYEDSMAAAVDAAAANGWHLLSDSTWPGYSTPAVDVMEGYLIMGAEVVRQVPCAPTHIFLQAGVGGLAAACAASARAAWGTGPQIIVVEPDRAPALYESILAGAPVATSGGVSAMGRLDCKEPSHVALKYLAREADHFMLITEQECADTVTWLSGHGVVTSPSGAAGVAGLRAAAQALDIGAQSHVLAYVSEGAQDGDG
ncbi:pyridoxal-phosphate dependent enzyme [Minwuia sp.]|uniref:pyridoxal-phosphate dependent enzyme n=1 Tax=Minwuia sp. TaxID=2493630 RepID=UPI003A8E106A